MEQRQLLLRTLTTHPLVQPPQLRVAQKQKLKQANEVKVRSNTLTNVEDQLQGFGAEDIVQNLFMLSIHPPSIFTPPG